MALRDAHLHTNSRHQHKKADEMNLEMKSFNTTILRIVFPVQNHKIKKKNEGPSIYLLALYELAFVPSFTIKECLIYAKKSRKINFS